MAVEIDGVTFTPRPDCDNCDGTGIFEPGDPPTLCHFCVSDAIRAGELDGMADDVKYVAGRPVAATVPQGGE